MTTLAPALRAKRCVNKGIIGIGRWRARTPFAHAACAEKR
jgi:hypothetical protein